MDCSYAKRCRIKKAEICNSFRRRSLYFLESQNVMSKARTKQSTKRGGKRQEMTGDEINEFQNISLCLITFVNNGAEMGNSCFYPFLWSWVADWPFEICFCRAYGSTKTNTRCAQKQFSAKVVYGEGGSWWYQCANLQMLITCRKLYNLSSAWNHRLIQWHTGS